MLVVSLLIKTFVGACVLLAAVFLAKIATMMAEDPSASAKWAVLMIGIVLISYVIGHLLYVLL